MRDTLQRLVLREMERCRDQGVAPFGQEESERAIATGKKQVLRFAQDDKSLLDMRATTFAQN